MTRTIKQNEYYHGVVIPLVRSGLYDLGYNLSPIEVHEFLKDRFLKKQILCEISWTYQSAEGSTKALTTKEFQSFISEIQQWSAEYLNVYVNDPNEQ